VRQVRRCVTWGANICITNWNVRNIIEMSSNNAGDSNRQAGVMVGQHWNEIRVPMLVTLIGYQYDTLGMKEIRAHSLR
jgi:hypothetical protein